MNTERKFTGRINRICDLIFTIDSPDHKEHLNHYLVDKA